MRTWIGTGWLAAALFGLVVIAALAVVLAWLGPLHPAFEAVSAVRPQIAMVALVPAVGLLMLQRWQLGGLALVVATVLWFPLIGYLTATPDPVAEGAATAKLMQYNVYFGNEDYPAIVEHVTSSGADVVALHELFPSQWNALAPLLDGGYPYNIAEPLAEEDGAPGGGMVLISRTPLTRLPVDPAISPPDRVTIAATTMINDIETMVVALHPPASRHEPFKADLRARQLKGVAELAGNADMPAVVIADLNVTPTSSLYGEFLDDLGWRDPLDTVGWQSTWPTWGGPFGLAIDQVFVSDEFALHDYHVGHGAGSDHKSVVVTVSLRPTVS